MLWYSLACAHLRREQRDALRHRYCRDKGRRPPRSKVLYGFDDELQHPRRHLALAGVRVRGKQQHRRQRRCRGSGQRDGSGEVRAPCRQWRVGDGTTGQGRSCVEQLVKVELALAGRLRQQLRRRPGWRAVVGGAAAGPATVSHLTCRGRPWRLAQGAAGPRRGPEWRSAPQNVACGRPAGWRGGCLAARW